MSRPPKKSTTLAPYLAIGAAILAILFANLAFQSDAPMRFVFIGIAITCIMSAGLVFAIITTPGRK